MKPECRPPAASSFLPFSFWFRLKMVSPATATDESAALQGMRTIEVRAPETQTAPYVFASPHSGRDYSEAFLAASRLDPLTLRRSEDCFVDELFAAAPELGSPLLLAHFPRAFCDANRNPAELDPAVFEGLLPESPESRSPRVVAGLGVIARIVRDGADIYRRRLPLAEGELRLRCLHRPYHEALEGLVETTRARFGICVLVDCHSMPSQAVAAPGTRGRMPDMILGDRYGASCAPALTDHADRLLTGLGFVVTRNTPYAGGYTAEHYGRPQSGVHALQIEINRALYLDEDRLEKRPEAFSRLKLRLDGFLAELLAFRP
jgi:N-formylglutamate amidohydrolase